MKEVVSDFIRRYYKFRFGSKEEYVGISKADGDGMCRSPNGSQEGRYAIFIYNILQELECKVTKEPEKM